MAKEHTWVHKNVELSLLASEIEKFFRNDGFSDVMADKDPNGAWFEIQAAKKGAAQTLVASRKALHVIIRGEPNNFMISMTQGEWGKNVAAALLIPVVGWIGLFGGLPMTAYFYKKVRKFIESTVEKLENTATSRVSMDAQQPNVVYMQSCPHCNGQTNEYYGRQYCHNCKVYL